MNHLYITLILSALKMTQLAAQSNFPFPKDHAEWLVYQQQPVIGPEDAYYVYRNFIQGDSVFNGKTYSKAYYQKLCSCSVCSVPVNYGPDADQTVHLIGGVREEAGKVYYTSFGGTGNSYFSPVQDTMLFDFTLQPNDTFQYSYVVFRVTAVDTASDGRKQIHLENIESHYPRTWIEGIGADGLFVYDYSSWRYQNGSCFSNTFPSSCSIPCAVTTAVTPAPMEEKSSVFPSLAYNDVTVTFPEHYLKTDLTIFSFDGRVIKSIRGLSSGDHVAVFDLNSGVYYFRLTMEDGRFFVYRVVK